MKRFNWMTATTVAAMLMCSGLAFGQDAKPDAQPGQDTPAPKFAKPAADEATKKKDEKAETKKLQPGDAAPTLAVEKWVKGDAITGFEKGRVYVVEFWATWCAPCKESMPHLSELQKQYKDKGLTIIGVSSVGCNDKIDKVEDMVKEKGDTMGYTVAWDKDGATNTSYMKAAKQRGIPRSFVVDQKGNIAWIGHPAELDFVLDDIIASKWDYKTGPEKIDKMNEEADKIREDAEGDPKATLKAIATFEEKYPKMAKDMVPLKYDMQLQSGLFAEAAKTGAPVAEKIMARKDADAAEAMNAFAWSLVDPEGTYAKGAQQTVDLAMKVAAKAVEVTDSKNGAILDTLARCYWLKGNKAKAIELEKKAITALSKDEAEKMGEELEKTLKDYEGGKN